MKKILIGAILILSCMTIGVTAFMFYGIRNDRFPFLNTDLELVNTQHFALEDIENLEISYVAEHINIYESETDELIIKEYMNRTDSKYFAASSQTGSTLKIRHGNRVMSWFLRSATDIYLPAGYTDALDISTVSGSIDSDLTFTNSQLQFSTVSGAVRLDTVNADLVDLSTTSGAIRIQTCNGSLSASTVSGTVQVEEGQYSGDVSTTSGSIHLNPSTITDHVKLSSVSGSVKLKVTENHAFDFKASSVSGSIQTWFGDQIGAQKHKVSGRIGSNPDFRIDISTTSGSIKIFS